MAIFVVDDVPLLPQDKTNGCWYFSAQMMASWSRKIKRSKPITDPSILDDLRNLYEGNCGWAPSTCGVLAGKLEMKALPKVQRGFSEMHTLAQSGPIYAAGMKKEGADRFPHVVVIGGVADTGVLVLDPLPLGVGERSWKTWTWFDGFIDLGGGGVFDANLLVPA